MQSPVGVGGGVGGGGYLRSPSSEWLKSLCKSLSEERTHKRLANNRTRREIAPADALRWANRPGEVRILQGRYQASGLANTAKGETGCHEEIDKTRGGEEKEGIVSFATKQNRGETEADRQNGGGGGGRVGGKGGCRGKVATLRAPKKLRSFFLLRKSWGGREGGREGGCER